MFVVFMPRGAGPKTIEGALAVMVAGLIGVIMIVASGLYASYETKVVAAQRAFSMASGETRVLLGNSSDAHEKISAKLLFNAGALPGSFRGAHNTIQLPYDGRLDVSATADAVTLTGVWFTPGMVAKRFCNALMKDETQNLGKAYHASGNCDDPRKAELVVRYDRAF